MANDRIRLTPIILIIWSIAMEALSNGDSYYVGRDWLESGPINNEHMHIRKKRVVGTNINDANFTFVEVASQTMGSMLVEIGDSFTFEVTIDLPGILDTKKSDMVIEIFGLDSSNGVAGIHVCQAHEEEISGHGENIRSIQEYPVYVNEMPSHRKNFVAKTRMIREQLHTEGFGDVGNANKIQAQFQAVVVNAGLDENWSYQNGGTHYITVGIQYGDEFLWIGQASFIVDLKNQDYDFAVNIESGPIDTDKTSFMKGKGYIFTIRANVVEPVADVALQVFQPLGYNDVFHIGHIQRRMGNAFACSPQDGWQDKYSLSPSDLTVNNASIFYSFLVNREAQRDISNDANEIVFLVPVHVMNIDSLPPGVNRTLSFVLQVGKEKIWTTLEERPISDQPLTLSNGVTPTFLSVRLLNNVTSNQIPKGDSIVFLVELRCPKSAYCKFDVELLSSANGQPAIPVGARIINGGTIAYFSPPWSVYANQDENVVVSFGKVENPASEDTDVSLELTYALDPTADDAHLIELVNPKIGGLPIVLPKDLKASSNNLNSMLKVEIDDFGFDENVHIHGQAAFELRVTVESGAGAEGLVLEAIPDLDFDHELRICSLRILDIGRGLPCVYHSHYKPNAEYYKSDETLPFNNLAKLKLDRICPYSVPKMDKNDNQFVARIVYESPTALKTTPSTFKLNGGLRIKDEVVWVASKSFQLIDTAMNTTNLEYAQGSDVSSSPFVATYPTIATRGRKPSFHPGEGISEQYILKFPPLSRGAYNFVLKPYAHSRACKIKITHIGENYPCTQPPGPMITGFENIEIQYDSNGNNMESEFGESVTLKLKGLTNWGRSPVHFDLTPDENSIQVVAFYQLDPKAIFTVNDVMDLNFELHEASSNGKVLQKGNTTHALDPIVLPTGQKHLPIPNVTVEFLNVATMSKGLLFKKAPNILRIHVPIPATMLGDMKVSLVNVDFASGLDLLQFCNLTLTEQGANIPCVHPINSVSTNYSADAYRTLENNITLYKSIDAYVNGICHFAYSRDTNDNYLTFEASVLVLNETQEGKEVSLKIVIESEEFMGNGEVDIILPNGNKPRIAEPLENDVVVDLVTPNEAQVVALEGNPSTCEIGEKIWIGYNITVPRGKTIKMEAALLLPSENNRALFHAVDVKFDTCNGKNVLCMNPSIDLQRTFPTTFLKSSNITTFMQRDIVTIDFGYVTNAGLSFKQGLYDGDLDDTFSLRFLIQKSDHQIWDRNMDRPIQCSIKFGDVATVVESWIGFEISKLKEEQGQMFITSNLSEPSKQYENGDTIYVQSVIKHDEMSTREGYPTFIQVIVPHYLTYKENSDSFLTNYSSIGNDEIVTVTVANTSGILFQFPQGISFPDIVELNFSLSVEMDGKRPIGSGVESSAIVFAPICFHSGHNKTNSSVSNCGSLRALPFESCAPECLDEITFNKTCQITASSTFDESLFPPHFVIPSLSNSPVSGWAPALKTPLNSRSEFPDYLEFNFLAAVRIGQIYVHSETDTFRQVKTIQIQYGHIHGFFTNWKDPVRLDLGPKIEIDPSLEAQFIRLILVSTDIQDVMEKPPGISKVEFKGCLPQPQQLSSCQNEEESSRASEYFAVDDFRDIVYYCERLDTRARTNCYASGGRGIVAGWTELPKYVSSLIGYDQEEKLMLFTGLTDRYCFKSVDGQKITQLDCTKLETLPSLIEANRIRRPETTTSPQKGTWTGQQLQYGGRLEGIYDETNIILQWKSCCL
ncbi:uncharacterized protein LOC131886721 [Tigriopus californicus]|uniref:uncharacterized protein LOC131886721 n=1 Tax=Tigriopus californicus TaxID=6832 RepID=UPI0027D9F705|nr:uncharacterized protein LOC131886721 [Tigriopus californicus]